MKAWLRAYAAATATTTSCNRILDAATPGDEKPARGTTEAYRNVLQELFVLDSLTAWVPAGSQLRRLAQAPAHRLVDPALATRLLGLSEAALLRGYEAGPCLCGTARNLLGRLFESLVVQSVRVYAQAVRASVYLLRTSRGDHEVDIIVERSDGRIVAMEVKLTSNVTDDDAEPLKSSRPRIPYG